MEGFSTRARTRVAAMRWRLGAVTTAAFLAVTTAALAGTLDTSATLSTQSTVPSTVNIGANSFTIDVTASGGVPGSQSGDASVATVYNMATDGTITASTALADQASLHFTPGQNYSQCPTTNIPLGCAANPFVVHATLNVASGTAGGTKGTLTVSDAGSSGLSSDSTPAQGYVQVYSPVADNPPTNPGAPATSSTLNNDGVFTVSWGASSVNDGDTITYTLEHANASGSWSTVASGLSGTSYSFGSGGNLAEGEGTWSYRVTANDSGGLSSNPATSADLVTVDESAPLAPTAVVSPSTPDYIDGSMNAWYKDSVTVGFSGNGDPLLLDGSAGSGVDPTSLTPTSTFDSSDVNPTTGAFSDSGTVADNAGNVSAPTTVSGFVDWLAPTVDAGPTAPAVYTDGSGNNWWKDSVSFSVSASDPAPSSGLNLDPSGGYGPYTGVGSFPAQTAEDNVGHTGSSGPIPYNVDSVSPLASFTSCPTTAPLLNGSATASWTASDPSPSSGLATASSGSVTLDTSQPGLHQVSSPAPVDNVGHTGVPASCSYNVNYAESGFLPPVANDPILNTGKAGRTYPLKWQLQDANGAYIGDLSAVSSIVLEPVTCGAFTNTQTSTDTATTTGGTSLRYDSTDNQYVYNWAAPSKTGCYEVFLNLASGQVMQADFQLK